MLLKTVLQSLVDCFQKYQQLAWDCTSNNMAKKHHQNGVLGQGKPAKVACQLAFFYHGTCEFCATNSVVQISLYYLVQIS
jgi:hypothetical protein